MRGINKYGGIALIVGASVFFTSGCITPKTRIINRQHTLERAARYGVLIYGNGALSDEMRQMFKQLARKKGMVCLSRRIDIQDILEAGENSMYGNHIGLHSLAASDNQTKKFMQWCEENDIEFENAYVLGGYQGLGSYKFPEIINEIINYHSTFPHIFGEWASRGGKISRLAKIIGGSNHLNLPWKAMPFIDRKLEQTKKRRLEKNKPKLPKTKQIKKKRMYPRVYQMYAMRTGKRS